MKRRMKLLSLLLANAIAFSAAVSVIASEYHSPFTDLSAGSWCYGYVTSMVSHGFIDGYEDNTFRPEALITRAEAATVLSKLGLPAIIKSKEFYDVQPHTWYYDEIQQTYTSGGMLGINHDTSGYYFAPNDYLTRSDAAIIASRLYGFQKNYSSVNLRNFSDYHEIAYGAQGHIQNLMKAGILSGYSDGTLRPNQPITRAEFSRIFNFICYLSSYEMRTNLEEVLENEHILNEDTALSEVGLQFDVADKLAYGRSSSTKVKIKTENIPDGTVLPLSITSNSSGLTIPESVTVYNNVATFYIYSTPFTANMTYVLTTEYEGMYFSTNVYLEKEDTLFDDVYIEDITVEGTLKYGRRDSVEITVNVDDVPNGEYLTAEIEGPGLSLENDEVRVKNGKAIFTAESKSTTPTGVYTFKVGYEGHYRTAKVVVSEVKSDDPYILNVAVSGILEHGKNDRIKMTVRTNDLPNGQYITATLYGNGNAIYPADAGISVTEKVLVYENEAEITVYSSYYTPEGTYYLMLDYNGHTYKVYFYVGDAADDDESEEVGYIKSIEVDGYLYEDENDYVKVTVKTSDVPDGTILYPEAEGDLEVPYSCVVYNNRATFYVYNPDSVKDGRYDITIDYNGETYKTTVRVKD